MILSRIIPLKRNIKRDKTMNISKRDWKLFQDKLPAWQEKYMECLIMDYIDFLKDNTKKASDRFWQLEKRIKKDKQNPGVVLNMDKGEAVWNIVNLMRSGVIEAADLLDFSDELKHDVETMLDISRG